ncbi:polypeptide N-acetylgalactosaminyltransferase 14-like [Solea senegalensis]|uniref:Polypeptide N-acetylgalactosaminyltransferase 14-like n=1 Tax=Solea senegalensis TaxID=28829 RepID=A0AAV6PMW1_SOLSE|nr:polypeptide N-acetylgalactosaminyltransferase 14-like [Solea senegalensis]KAG7508527.1 polypeptide N-acetylgalactosaminyltransferase 14-like [Solea senegalensis]
MKRVCRRLAVAVAVLVWLGALVYLLVLSRRRLPELGTGPGAGPGPGPGETAYSSSSQVKYNTFTPCVCACVTTFKLTFTP